MMEGKGLLTLILGGWLALLSYYDWRDGLLYNKLVYPLGVLGLILSLGGNMGSIEEKIVAALLGAGFLLLLRIISHGGLGWGDIKLMAALGFWLDWRLMIVALYLAFMGGGMMALYLYYSGRADLKTKIPFGPFLGIASWLSFCFGESIFRWYEGLL